MHGLRPVRKEIGLALAFHSKVGDQQGGFKRMREKAHLHQNNNQIPPVPSPRAGQKGPEPRRAVLRALTDRLATN